MVRLNDRLAGAAPDTGRAINPHFSTVNPSCLLYYQLRITEFFLVAWQVSFLLFVPVCFSSVSDSYFYPFSRLCLPFYISFLSVSYIIPIILDSLEKT